MSGTLVMMTLTEIAARDGVSKMAVSKQVKKMLAARPETPIEQDAQGRVMRVSVADYDEFRSRHVNPAKVTAPLRGDEERQPAVRPPQTFAPASDSFEEARRQAEWIKVRREKVRHQEAVGQLVRRDTLDEALRLVGREVQSSLMRMQNRADDVVKSMGDEGIHGVRMALRKIALDLGNEIADRLQAISETAPPTDEAIESEDA